jgi:hypothetical protein
MIYKSLAFLLLVSIVVGNSIAAEDEDDEELEPDLIDDLAFDRLFDELQSSSDDRKWRFPRIARVELIPGNGSSVQGKLKLYQFKDGLFIRGKIYGLTAGNLNAKHIFNTHLKHKDIIHI